MSESHFTEKDHLAWNRFMLLNVLALSISYARERDGTAKRYLAFLRGRLEEAWSGLGAQGVEGAMLGSTLTIESIGSAIHSSQSGPEGSEILTESVPGQAALSGMRDRFDVELTADEWYQVIGVSQAEANQIYDILGAIADGADIEYERGEGPDETVRISLRAW